MFNIIYSTIYVFIYTINMSIIMNILHRYKLSIKSISIFTVINFTILFFLQINQYTNLMFISILVLSSTYIYIQQRNIAFALTITTLMIIILAISDLASGFTIINVFKVTYVEIVDSKKIYFATLLLVAVYSFLFSKLIKCIMYKIYDLNINYKKYKRQMIVLLIYLVVIVSFIFVFLNFSKEYSGLTKTILILYSFFILFSVIIIATFFGLSYKDIKEDLQKEQLENEYKQLKEYTEMLESVTSNLRSFRHDYLNILKTFGGYIETEDLVGLNSYFNDLLSESVRILYKDKCFILIQNIKIKPLKSLIASKFVNAQSIGIMINVEIVESIEEVSINLIDICRICGILLDNAIEAAAQSEEKTIKFAIVAKDKEDIFIIENSCSKNVPQIHKIYERNFSTKGDGRGIGLNIVREIIREKYPSNIILNTRISGTRFTQELILNKK